MQPENHQQKPLAVTSPQEQQGRGKTNNKTAIVFATHKFMRQKELTGMEIVFCGLPYEVELP